MLPRGWAWQDCISLCVSIRPGELRGVSALAGLGSPRRGIHGGCCSQRGERVIRGASSLPLDLPPSRFSHLPKRHRLFCPIRRSQDNFSISYNKQASHGYVCFCSWQNNTGISPYYWLLLMACHGSLSFGARFPHWPAEMRKCRCRLQKFMLKIWWFRVLLFVWLDFQVGFIFTLIVRIWSASFVPQLSVYTLL